MWFSSFRKTQRRLQREEGVFHWFCLFVFWCPCQRDFADCVRMAPPADNWPEIAVEFWSWREEVLLSTMVGDCFLILF